MIFRALTCLAVALIVALCTARGAIASGVHPFALCLITLVAFGLTGAGALAVSDVEQEPEGVRA